ncbi:MAG: hypothetical protein ACE37H_01790 [Phycisphaeraceae bacterium]
MAKVTKKRPHRSSNKASRPIVLKEPHLLFHYEQATEDPRDGLTLFGPLEKGKPYGIRFGVVGTADGVKYFREWVTRIQTPVGDPDEIARPVFPGFEAAFGIPWKPNPQHEVLIDEAELHRRLNFGDRHHRVYKAVDLYEEAILKIHTTEESPVDLWFVVVPDDVHRLCRPQSTVDAESRIDSREGLSKSAVSSAASGQSHLFNNDLAEELAQAYNYEVNFHNQLKARLLTRQIVTQIARESTIAFRSVLGANGEPLRDLSVVEQDIAWHLATAAFYKAGGRPWKIDGMRDGVCYLGIVFKHVDLSKNPHMACCAAQMFLNSGDGVVFKGNNGPWYTGRRGDFHIDEASATDLVQKAIESYKTKSSDGQPPRELFIHAKTKFNETEWNAFLAAAGTDTNVVAVQIQEEHDFKLYRAGKNPVLRGTAICIDESLAYLWTRGLTPRLRTYVGREVPNPLTIKICRGKADIAVVLNDVLGLTKLNYNACRFGDGEPVTLKFADAVGEILTAGPVFEQDVPPLPFKHYV